MPSALIIAWPLLAGLALAGCGSEPPTPSEARLDYKALVEALRRTGVTVEPGEKVTQPFFSVKGKLIAVNGEDVQVFEYSDAGAARSEAARVSSDGSSVGTTMVTWMGPPHFYRRDRVIVLYVGDTPAVKTALEAVLGPQFAGR